MNKPILKAYKIRLYPTDEQQVFFAKSFGCARFIWNKMLADKIAHYKIHQESLKNTPAQYKKEFEWLKEVDSLGLANVQLNLHKALSSFATMLTYKAEWYGKTLIKVDRWFPSSKTCSNCSHVLSKDELTLSDRAWDCKVCHTHHDRDINASINILNEGMRCLQTIKTVGATGLA